VPLLNHNHEVRHRYSSSTPYVPPNPHGRIETCHLCSRPTYPSKGITFVRNDARVFRFCRSKCHKNFKMKRQPRKLRWTKTHRALRGKEMVVDASVLLSQFAQRRNAPVKYDRNLVQATLRAMERVEQIRQRRERVLTRRRLSGKEQREKRKREDRRVVAMGEHLIAKEMKEREQATEVGVVVQEQAHVDVNVGQVVGEERVRMKAKRRMLVGGGTVEEMDVD
jgi:large subunit ribosomal protein L24e